MRWPAKIAIGAATAPETPARRPATLPLSLELLHIVTARCRIAKVATSSTDWWQHQCLMDDDRSRAKSLGLFRSRRHVAPRRGPRCDGRRMPGTDGIEATWRIVEELPRFKVTLLTTNYLDERAFSALRHRASGFLESIQ